MDERHEEEAARRWRRREAIVAIGGAGLGALALATPALRRLAGPAFDTRDAWAQACEPSPEQTEGPYYVENSRVRRNVTEQGAGAPLWVSLKVVAAQSCSVIPGAVVEIWHADALGNYSGFNGLEDRTFMRGRQTVGDAGIATFRTVYPGWYTGRTPHVHVKVLVAGSEAYTGQLYFDEAVTDAVYAQEPYASRGDRDTTNATDGIFANGGAESLLALQARGKGYWGSRTLVVPA
jgi:protocatechuate 3,4-dioxygenase beta subunit